jgi:putative membrane protein
MRAGLTAAAKLPATDTNTQLAVERTRVAYERTLMAWIRTATGLISFGFTIYKFFEFETTKDPTAVHHLISPRHFAMIMIGIGLVALSLSVVDHRRRLRLLGRESDATPPSIAGVVATLIAIMGLLAFVAVLFRA